MVKLIPKVRRRPKKTIWNDPRIEEAREKLQIAKSMDIQEGSSVSRSDVQSKKNLLNKVYDDVNKEILDEKIKLVEKANQNCQHKAAWDLVNEISGRRTARKGQIRGETQNERLQSWYSHFQQLLGNPPVITDEKEVIDNVFPEFDIRTDAFDQEEYENAKKVITEGKSPGEDEIPPEVLKRCHLDDIILKFCNDALIYGKKPEQWSMLNLIPIPKSGDLRDGKNYRGICLSSIVAKTYNRMLLNRIRPHIDPVLRINQNGFRPGRSTVSQILALRRIIEEIKNKNLRAALVFIDFKKAFDTVHRGKMLDILRAYGVPERLVKAIGHMYEHTIAHVSSPDGVTDDFPIQAGVLQGDTLAPFLFIVVLDYVLRKALQGNEDRLGFTLVQRKSRRIGPQVITDMDFADDIALLANCLKDAEELLQLVESNALKVGLGMNAKKTKAMIYNEPPSIIKTLDGSDLEIVTDFKYLGAWIASSESDLNIRKAQAWKACNSMDNIWKSSLLRSLKIRLFTTTIEPVLTYGAEAWTLTSKMKKALDGCYTRLLRKALNVSWKSHITNQELYGDLLPISERLRTRRLKFAGHCVRSEAEVVSKVLLWQPTHGKRSRGPPKKDYIKLLAEDTGLDTQDLKNCMEDRVLWRSHHKRPTLKSP